MSVPYVGAVSEKEYFRDMMHHFNVAATGCTARQENISVASSRGQFGR